MATFRMFKRPNPLIVNEERFEIDGELLQYAGEFEYQGFSDILFLATQAEAAGTLWVGVPTSEGADRVFRVQAADVASMDPIPDVEWFTEDDFDDELAFLLRSQGEGLVVQDVGPIDVYVRVTPV